MKHTAHMAYYTEKHKVYPIECGIIVFDSNATTERGLYRAAEKHARQYIEGHYPHATGYAVSNVK